jgi:hypothetical protein
VGSDTTRHASHRWPELSCLVLLTTGAFAIVEGIMAIGRSSFYDPGASYVIVDLEGWGVVILVLGVVQLVAAGLLARGRPHARLAGLVAATLLVVYALTVHWDEIER